MNRHLSSVASPRPRALNEIAAEIEFEWDGIPPRAAEIVDALGTVERVTDRIYGEPAGALVRELLSLAKGWTGDRATEIKKELTRKANGTERQL